ncbi:PEP-CTERM motif protein [bacterium BMS3Abin11]|nr:PEP-CTERM motif protein [bacterium BMS3Abin11]
MDVLPDNLAYGRYYVVNEFDLSVGNFSWSSLSLGYIQVRDVLPTSPFYREEAYSVVKFGGFSPSTGSLDDIWVTTAFAAVLGSDELDGIGLPDFVPFDASLYSYRLLFGSFRNSLQLSGTIDSIEVVPEPATLALFGIGLAGLWDLPEERSPHSSS